MAVPALLAEKCGLPAEVAEMAAASGPALAVSTLLAEPPAARSESAAATLARSVAVDRPEAPFRLDWQGPQPALDPAAIRLLRAKIQNLEMYRRSMMPAPTVPNESHCSPNSRCAQCQHFPQQEQVSQRHRLLADLVRPEDALPYYRSDV